MADGPKARAMSDDAKRALHDALHINHPAAREFLMRGVDPDRVIKLFRQAERSNLLKSILDHAGSPVGMSHDDAIVEGLQALGDSLDATMALAIKLSEQQSFRTMRVERG